MSLPEDCLKYFAKMIEAEIGIVYSEVNYYQLESRLEEVARHLGAPGAQAFWEKIKLEGMNTASKLLLVDVATNNETSFFRDPNVFKAITRIVSDAIATLPKQPYRIWSAACSSGQETYSLAMLLSELNQKTPFTYQMFASDIAERVLKRAEAGVYSQLDVQRGLSMPQLIKHFTHDGDKSDSIKSWSVKPELKKNLQFKKLNLLDPWPGLQNFDLILCRNVLIYQTIENKKRVLAKLFEHLNPGGYLVLGGAESLIGLFDGLEYTTMENVVVYKRPVTSGQASAAG